MPPATGATPPLTGATPPPPAGGHPHPEELVPGVRYADFVAAAEPFQSEADFRRSDFFARHGAALDRLLATPRRVVPSGGARPAPAGSAAPLRIVHWNIEKGKALDRIRRRLVEEPRLAGADTWCFNEVDVGTARTGNVDVAQELSDLLGAPGWFVPNYIECTKGLINERALPGENRLGLHGLLVLSRRPIREAEVVVLPPAWDYFDFWEKRFGGRRALLLNLEAAGRPVVVGTTHLEMRCHPSGRARQMSALLQALPSISARWSAPAQILTGDLNTHTFRRGSLLDTLIEFPRVAGSAPETLAAQLLAPFGREPLFRHLEEAGFSWEPFNDAAPTAWQSLGSVEDLKFLPRPVGQAVLGVFRLAGRRLPLRLDWIAGRGFAAAGSPRTVSADVPGDGPASDHEPITAVLAPKG